MSDIKSLKCQNCGSNLSSDNLVSTLANSLLFECSSCRGFSVLKTESVTKEPVLKEKTTKELAQEMRQAYKDFMYPD